MVRTVWLRAYLPGGPGYGAGFSRRVELTAAKAAGAAAMASVSGRSPSCRLQERYGVCQQQGYEYLGGGAPGALGTGWPTSTSAQLCDLRCFTYLSELGFHVYNVHIA